MQDYISIAKSGRIPICVLDRTLSCVYGNGVIEKGTFVADILRDCINLPIRSHYEGTVALNDNFYYVRIYVISDAPDPQYYLCETVDAAQAWGVLRKAAPEQLAAIAASLRYNANDIHDVVEAFENGKSAGAVKMLPMLSTKINRFLGIINGFSDYIEMMVTPGENVLFDVGKLCERICQRCNAALTPYNRCIDMPLYDEELYVYTDGRRAVTALLNAVFNALMYSSEDVVPQIIVYRDDSTASAVVKLINAPFEAQDSVPGGLYGSALGLSMALIRDFAALAGGSVEVPYADKTVLKIAIPIAAESDKDMFKLEQQSFCDTVDFDRCISDFISYYI